MEKKSSDAPAQQASDSSLTKKMAQIMHIDDDKRGEVKVNEGPVTAITEAPKATASEIVAFQPTEEARAEVDPTSAIVPVQSVPMPPPVQRVPMQSVPVQSVRIQSVIVSDALTPTPRARPAATAAKERDYKLSLQK